MSVESRTANQLGLTELVEQTRERRKWSEPLRFNLNNNDDLARLEELIAFGDVLNVHDEVQLIADDLFDLHHPDQKDHKNPEDYSRFTRAITESGGEYGEWFFFPWSGDLARYPEKDDLRRLHTAKNRNLVTEKEQDKLYDSTVAIFGLSVGSNVVASLLRAGIGGKLIIADMDIIEPTNLNRIRTDFTEVGNRKVDTIAKQISKVDPYIEQVHLSEGLNPENLEEVVSEHRPDVMVDEVDSLPIKILIRKTAQREGIPVLMTTDDGDNALIDVERYDQEGTELFDGRMPEEVIGMVLSGDFSREKLGMIIGKHFVGAENIPLRMFQSLGEVGETLPSWPQLGNAANTGGEAVAYAAKRIILGYDLPTLRTKVDFDELMNPDIHTQAYQDELRVYRQMLDDM